MDEVLQRRSAFFELRGVLGFVLLGFLATHPTFVPPHLWALGIAFLLSNLLILVLPSSKFNNPAVAYAIFFVDLTVLTVFIWAISSQSESVLLYYLTVFMATLGGDLRKSVAIAVVAAALFLGFQLSQGGPILHSPQALMHLPLFFVTAITTGYLAQEVSVHRTRLRHLNEIQRALESQIEGAGKELARSEDRGASAHDLARRFQDLLHGLDAIVWEADAAANRLVFVSRKAEAILGYPSEQWVTNPRFWLDRLHPEDRARTLRAFRAIQRSGHDGQVEYRMMAADGREIWFRNLVQVVRTESGSAGQLRGVMIDITRPKEVDLALQASETRYRLLFESNPQAMWVYDVETLDLLAVNDAAVALYGYSRPEFLAKSLKEIWAPEDVPALLKAIGHKPARMEAAGIWRHRKKDGTIIDAEISSHFLLFSDRPAELVLATDITERRRTQAALAQLAAIVTSSMDAIISKTLDGVITGWNPGAERLYGYSSQEVMGRPVSILVPSDRLGEMASIMEKVKRGERIDYFDTVRVRKDGRQIDVGVTISPMFDPSGRITGASTVARDITERRRAEKAVRQSEDRFRLFVEHAPAAIAMFDRDMRYVATSRRWLTDYHLGQRDVIGRSHYEVFPDLSPHWKDIHQRCLAGAVEKCEEDSFIGPDGKTEWVRWEVRPWRDYAGDIAGTLLFSEVITERKKMEEQLRQSAKIEAIGQLAGGVAHDFNNLLTIIAGYGQLMLEDPKLKEPQRAHAKEIVQASDRAASLTRQLLAFSRRQVLAPQVLDLNAVVANLDKMLRRLIGEDIDLVTRLEPGLGRVKADPGQIEQVIMNLAVNARDAMAGGGKLTLETANADLDDACAAVHPPIVSGRYVMFSVSDSGTGMDAETLAHMFEPFFTTKGQGKGTGLGLATVYGIVKQSNGYIWVYSEPGRGTTFKIYLPTVEEAVARPQAAEFPRATPQATETVLVVEDEIGVRSLVHRVLTSCGYNVIEASRGDEAIARCEAHNGPLHLLVTDVVMPQMSGRELATLLAARHPDLKVLFMSGYTNEGIVHNGVLARDTAFLQKPFAPHALVGKVREVLDASASSKVPTA